MLRTGEILFQLVAATAHFPNLGRHPVTGRIGILEPVFRIERAISQALAHRPGGRGFVSASARLCIRLLDQGLPAPRPGRCFVHKERADAVMIDAIEPTEAMPTDAVPPEIELGEKLQNRADAPRITR